LGLWHDDFQGLSSGRAYNPMQAAAFSAPSLNFNIQGGIAPNIVAEMLIMMRMNGAFAALVLTGDAIREAFAAIEEGMSISTLYAQAGSSGGGGGSGSTENNDEQNNEEDDGRVYDRDGNPLSFGHSSILPAIAGQALGHDGSTDWAYEVSKDNFGSNTNKCNKFVYDVLMELDVVISTDPGLPNGNAIKKFFGGGSPPTAAQWADPNYHIPNWKVVTVPAMGDIVAVRGNFTDATGHVAIMISPTHSIGASHNSVRVTDFGSSAERLNGYPGNNGYVYRRWSPGH